MGFNSGFKGLNNFCAEREVVSWETLYGLSWCNSQETVARYALTKINVDQSA